MRDVVKTNVKREQNSKRKRRRKKNVKLYFFLMILLVLGVGVLLSVTVLFNVSKVNIVGDDVNYSTENIIKAAGIKAGDNLVRLDAKAMRERLLASMIYVEDAKVSKKYPNTLEINLIRCVPFANVETQDGVLLISKGGKILEKRSEPDESIITIKGFEPINFKPGEIIKAKEGDKTEICLEIINAAEKYNEEKLKEIDITDSYDIKINLGDRITFEMGNSNDIAYKMNLADTVLKDLDKDKKGTMVMVGTNQISFRNSDSNRQTAAVSQGRIPIDSSLMPNADNSNSQGQGTNSSSNADNGGNGETADGQQQQYDYGQQDNAYDYGYEGGQEYYQEPAYEENYGEYYGDYAE